MARTVDTEAHAVRRETFVDAGQRLMQAKGWEQVSVQDILADTGASRGAFYHYFTSKRALLDAVVGRMVDVTLTVAAPVVDDPTLGAVAKLEGLYAGIARWKLDRPELMLAISRVWLSDENALTRDKMWRHIMEHLAPLLARVVEQGNDEGVFSVASPADTARVLVAIMHGLNDTAVRIFVDGGRTRATLIHVEAVVAAYLDALERILGVPAGTLTLVDRSALEEWFS